MSEPLSDEKVVRQILAVFAEHHMATVLSRADHHL
jgi:hypothetical protein